jgi:hypothetical protein
MVATIIAGVVVLAGIFAGVLYLKKYITRETRLVISALPTGSCPFIGIAQQVETMQNRINELEMETANLRGMKEQLDVREKQLLKRAEQGQRRVKLDLPGYFKT